MKALLCLMGSVLVLSTAYADDLPALEQSARTRGQRAGLEQGDQDGRGATAAGPCRMEPQTATQLEPEIREAWTRTRGAFPARLRATFGSAYLIAYQRAFVRSRQACMEAQRASSGGSPAAAGSTGD